MPPGSLLPTLLPMKPISGETQVRVNLPDCAEFNRLQELMHAALDAHAKATAYSCCPKLKSEDERRRAANDATRAQLAMWVAFFNLRDRVIE